MPQNASWQYQKKDNSTAYVLEIVFSIFGILGIGWLSSGEVWIGLSFLIGGIVAICFAMYMYFFSCCFIPFIGPVLGTISMLILKSYLNGKNEGY